MVGCGILSRKALYQCGQELVRADDPDAALDVILSGLAVGADTPPELLQLTRWNLSEPIAGQQKIDLPQARCGSNNFYRLQVARTLCYNLFGILNKT